MRAMARTEEHRGYKYSGGKEVRRLEGGPQGYKRVHVAGGYVTGGVRVNIT